MILPEAGSPTDPSNFFSSSLQFFQRTKIDWNCQHVFLSLSGGADSVCLFYFFLDLKKLFPSLCLSAVHFDHRVRDASFLDADFCKDLCKKAGVEFLLFVRDQEISHNSQDWFRKWRYQNLKCLCLSDCDWIATAHHKNDSLEQLWISFLQGRWDQRMKAFLPVDVKRRILRPFFSFSKQSLCAYLEAQKISWREDESNLHADYLRNWVRLSGITHCGVPAIKKIQSFLQNSRCKIEQKFSEISFAGQKILKKNICDWDLERRSDFFYWVAAIYFPKFMEKLDVKRIRQILSQNRECARFLISKTHAAELEIVETAKEYRWIEKTQAQ